MSWSGLELSFKLFSFAIKKISNSEEIPLLLGFEKNKKS
jgi:hypothetical protein